MKICGISDIHGNFRDIPSCDVLCICGDTINLNDQRNLESSRKWWYTRFVNWISRLPCKKVFLTAGNHDFFLEDAYKKGYLKEVKQDLFNRTQGKLEILINEECIYEGIKFFGCPFIQPIEFQEGRWAFERTKTEDGKSEYDSISEDVDILITHDNPYKNALLRYTLIKKNIKKSLIHFYGHWHNGFYNIESNEYNCSVLDDHYNIKKGFNLPNVEVMSEKDKIQIELEHLESLRFQFEIFAKVKGQTEYTIKDINDFLDVCKESSTLKLRDSEDEIPLPITSDIIEEAKDDEN